MIQWLRLGSASIQEESLEQKLSEANYPCKPCKVGLVFISVPSVSLCLCGSLLWIPQYELNHRDTEGTEKYSDDVFESFG